MGELNWRVWLSGKLLDISITDDEVAGIVACYPRIERAAPRPKECAQLIAEMEAERDEAVNWTAVVERHDCDQFDDLGDQWLAQTAIQRLVQALASVFAKYANEDLMVRHREQIAVLAHTSFIEGCLVGVRAEMARSKAVGE